MNEKMTITAGRFQALLDAYGADFSRWPEAERLAAHEYAKAAPEAARLMAEARAIDALLAAAPAPRPGERLEAAILAQIHEAMPSLKAGSGAMLASLLSALWPRAAIWKPASVFASALFLGALIGVNLAGMLGAPETVQAQDDLLAYAVPALMQDLSER